MAQLSPLTPPGGDPFAGSDRLMRVDEALNQLLARLEPVTAEQSVPLTDALGRVLARGVAAPFDVPPHDNSAVDGYAVFFDDLSRDAETTLPVTGRVAAGRSLGRPGRRGEAVRIFTGAPMPEGFDTVMMQEDCRAEGDTVIIRPGIKRGANRRKAGEDVARGQVVLAAGRRLKPQDIGLAASLGQGTLVVRAPLRVAVFSTGDEVRDPVALTGAPPENCIFDANRYSLMALLRRLGCAVTDLGILPDDPGDLIDALAAAGPAHDLVLTSGGVSAGEEDHVKAVVERLGALHFWRLAIKPGRPVALGRIGGTPFIGLPGNPVAVMVTFLKVARPLLLRLMGADAPAPIPFPVRADFAYRKKAGRREYLRAILAHETGGAILAHETGGAPVVRKHPREGAGVLSSMVESDGLVELPEDLTAVEPGALVGFLPFSALDCG
ncbi:MAG TPA: gephyrin-like molybdotransferase Glp [Azospirillaceae bacterium]|nr:gephyrin-like molybdotransferase Glp [Azospirillaceae bacterium]